MQVLTVGSDPPIARAAAWNASKVLPVLGAFIELLRYACLYKRKLTNEGHPRAYPTIPMPQ